MDRPRNNKGRFLRGTWRVVLDALITPFTPFQGVVRNPPFTNPLEGRTTRGGKESRFPTTPRRHIAVGSRGKGPTTNATLETIISSVNLTPEKALNDE